MGLCIKSGYERYVLPQDPRLERSVFGFIVGMPVPSVDMGMSIVPSPTSQIYFLPAVQWL